MRKIFFMIMIGCIPAANFCWGQNYWLGTKASYQPQQTTYAAAPAGYQPIFINHVGRHGSRYMTKASDDSLLFHVMNQARNEHGLTETGKQWMQLVIWLTQKQNGHYAEITLQGAEEHHDIAARMRQQYASLFVGKPIEIWYTHKLRTYQSAKGFVSAFPDKQQQSWKMQPENAETMLRFYDYSSMLKAYQDSDDKQNRLDSLHALLHMDAISAHIADRFIQPSLWEKWSKCEQKFPLKGKQKNISKGQFAAAIASVYGVLQSAKTELLIDGIDLTRIKVPFTVDEQYALGLVDNFEDDWDKGASTDQNGIQARIALPLLANMVATSDSLIAGTKTDGGIFRFTHAEAISPLATLLGLKQADSTFTSIKGFDYGVWSSATVIPMAANIQWIFYSDGQHILVKFLLNEKESRLPIAADQFPYYDWKKVRTYLLEKLPENSLNASFNWVDYLSHLK